MTDWSVAFEAAADDDDAHEIDVDRLLPLLDALGSHSPAVGGGGRRYEAQFNVRASDASRAWSKAIGVWRKAVAHARLPAWPIVRAEILTTSEQERILAQPPPELVGVAEIADELAERHPEGIEVTRSWASQVARKPGFPKPVAQLKAGPVWELSMVSRFLDDWRRAPGPAPGSRRPRAKPPPAQEPEVDLVEPSPD